MNFIDIMASVELVLAANQVPLLVGETGIGKTSLATRVAEVHDWELVTIDGNLLKEGEIGGLPTVETVTHTDGHGNTRDVKTTVYAVHHTLEHVAQAVDKGRQVLLFIDEINRAEHAVQQELMNLILNREINGFSLSDQVRIIAAMNPEDSFDYQTIDMDPAQQNRFVWLYMNADYMQWIDWAIGAGIEEKVIEFISSYPEYLNQRHEDDIDATPRSFERVSGLYRIYKNQEGTSYSRDVFMNVIRGNVGKLIAEAFVNFIESDQESPTRLYVAAKNMLHRLNRNSNAQEVHHFVEFLTLYPGDLRVAVMKDLRNTYERVYAYAIEDDLFVDTFFEAQK
ncbi:MAG: AAA family ATPase [Veillonella sp.]|nr:AAA family ATPase [Veillonella sp.]